MGRGADGIADLRLRLVGDHSLGERVRLEEHDELVLLGDRHRRVVDLRFGRE